MSEVRNLEEIGEIGETPYQGETPQQKHPIKGNTPAKTPQQKPYHDVNLVICA